MPDDDDVAGGAQAAATTPADEVRRQADRLRVLNDLARRLASMRDPAEVLHEVAAQARRLLGVDVACSEREGCCASRLSTG